MMTITDDPFYGLMDSPTVFTHDLKTARAVKQMTPRAFINPVECPRCHQYTCCMDKYCRTCGIDMRDNEFTRRANEYRRNKPPS